MRSYNVLVVGVGVLACAVFAGCGGALSASTMPSLTPSPSVTRLPASERVSEDELQTIFEQMVYCPGVMVENQFGGFLKVYALKHPDNASEAELQQVAFGWEVELIERDGPKDLDPQHPWTEYGQAVTTEGLHFVTKKCSEISGWIERGLAGEVTNVNGCLAVNRTIWDEGKVVPSKGKPVIPIFGEQWSFAPNLRVGDYLEAGGMYTSAPSDDEDAIIPEQCLATGITEYFHIAELEHVNCLIDPELGLC